MKRKEFVRTIASTTAVIAGAGTVGLVAGSCSEKRPVIDYNNTSKAVKGIRFGVSVYSYGNDFATGAANLERCMAEIADIGAEGIEILGEDPCKRFIQTPPKNGSTTGIKISINTNLCQLLMILSAIPCFVKTGY